MALGGIDTVSYPTLIFQENNCHKQWECFMLSWAHLTLFSSAPLVICCEISWRLLGTVHHRPSVILPSSPPKNISLYR